MCCRRHEAHFAFEEGLPDRELRPSPARGRRSTSTIGDHARPHWPRVNVLPSAARPKTSLWARCCRPAETRSRRGDEEPVAGSIWLCVATWFENRVATAEAQFLLARREHHFAGRRSGSRRGSGCRTARAQRDGDVAEPAVPAGRPLLKGERHENLPLAARADPVPLVHELALDRVRLTSLTRSSSRRTRFRETPSRSRGGAED